MPRWRNGIRVGLKNQWALKLVRVRLSPSALMFEGVKSLIGRYLEHTSETNLDVARGFLKERLEAGQPPLSLSKYSRAGMSLVHGLNPEEIKLLAKEGLVKF